MNTLFLILLPLIISGLGFITYRHPKIARKILMALLWVNIGAFLLLMVYQAAQSSAYTKASRATRIDINMPKDFLTNTDSLKIYLGQTGIQDSISNRVDTLIKAGNDDHDMRLNYYFIAMAIIAVLYGLSFLFDNIHNKEKVSNIDSTDKQTQ